MQEEKRVVDESFWTGGSVWVKYQQLWSFKHKSYEIRSRQIFTQIIKLSMKAFMILSIQNSWAGVQTRDL